MQGTTRPPLPGPAAAPPLLTTPHHTTPHLYSLHPRRKAGPLAWLDIPVEQQLTLKCGFNQWQEPCDLAMSRSKHQGEDGEEWCAAGALAAAPLQPPLACAGCGGARCLAAAGRGACAGAPHCSKGAGKGGTAVAVGAGGSPWAAGCCWQGPWPDHGCRPRRAGGRLWCPSCRWRLWRSTL
jgi:hypothetical protein